jgi:nitrilase
LLADLELDAIVRGKFDLDVVGHYARPDVFRLHVKTRAVKAVTSGDPTRAD